MKEGGTKLTDKEYQAKEELLSYAQLIESKREFIRQALLARDAAAKVTKAFSPTPCGKGGIPAGQIAVESIEQIAGKFDELANSCAGQICDMLDALNRIKDPLYVRVLRMRYIDWVGKTDRPPDWDAVSLRMHYDVSYVKLLHKRALNAYMQSKSDFYRLL